ncbi:MAG TPA: iron-sulfur cluster assembly protein [Streptosporangiales bacterium]
MTEADVVAALEDVHDAHVPVSLRAMGMLSGVSVDGGSVHVEVCMPCMACPASSYLSDRIRERVSAVDGVTSVDVELGWHLSWDRGAVDAEARELMRTHGIQL